MKLSKGEVDYVVEGVASNIRGDGRSRLEYREIVLETSIIASASGSARARLGAADVLVGIKAELGEAHGDGGKEGLLSFAVECSGVAGAQIDRDSANNLNADLTRSLDTLYKAKGVVDRQKLCLLEGRVAWTIFVDALVLQTGGNLIDAVSIAVRAALKNATVPRVEVTRGDGDEEDEIEIDDDPSSMQALPLGDLPVWISLSSIQGHWILDASQEEEFCMESRVSVGVDSIGNMCGLVKGGLSSLPWTEIESAIQTATKISATLIKKLDARQAVLENPVGFFG